MTPEAAIASMRAPSQMQIIALDVTNRCDLQCSNCTRLLAQQRRKWDMTPENFRLALQSLKGYDGIIAMIGGNPCLHPRFPELCRIFAEETPQAQRGLWSNNVFDHQEVIARTFGVYNLNPHNDERGIASIEKLRRYVSISYHKGSSFHAPLLAAVKDVIPDAEQMWDAISQCDINRNWSASIVQNQGQLRAYFCEVAASFDLARGEDHGHSVYEGWWRKPIERFDSQIRHFCPGCGVAARLEGRLDSEDTDDYSVSNTALAVNTRGKRKVRPLTQAVPSEHPVTMYNEAERQPTPVEVQEAMTIRVSVIIPCYNASATIRDTIASVAAQQLPPNVSVEVVVVDDRSSDDSREVVERAALAETRVSIRGMIMPQNSGPAAARNRGLRSSTADYVVFLDADDWLAPGFFWVLLHGLSEHPELAAIITDVELVNCHRDVLPAQMDAMVWSMPSNMIMRRSVADLLGGFPEDVAFRGKHASEDMIFKQALTAMFRVGWIRHPFLRYRVHRGSHFDLFLDTTTVVDGELKYLKDSDDAVDVATAIYMSNAGRRMQEIEAARVKPEGGESHVSVFEMKRKEV